MARPCSTMVCDLRFFMSAMKPTPQASFSLSDREALGGGKAGVTAVRGRRAAWAVRDGTSVSGSFIGLLSSGSSAHSWSSQPQRHRHRLQRGGSGVYRRWIAGRPLSSWSWRSRAGRVAPAPRGLSGLVSADIARPLTLRGRFSWCLVWFASGEAQQYPRRKRKAKWDSMTVLIPQIARVHRSTRGLKKSFRKNFSNGEDCIKARFFETRRKTAPIVKLS